MNLKTPELHAKFLRPLAGVCTHYSDPKKKPLEIDLYGPLPPRLRVYLYNMVSSVGTAREAEFKAVLRIPGQKPKEQASFSYSDGRVALLVAYHNDLDVFVLWDATLLPRFTYGRSVQVQTTTVLRAAALGEAKQYRWLISQGKRELVFACNSETLAATTARRVMFTGEVADADVAR